MVSDLLEEMEELLRQAEQLKQRIADLEKEVTVWKRASENHSYRALQSEDKCNKQIEINQELVDENESLKAQIEKMKGIIFDLLWFEDNLDPYMYDCNDAQKGNLLKPFDNAKDILKDCICKKCKGTGEVRVGYNGWITNPCPSCEGRGYIVKEIKENDSRIKRYTR